MGLQLEILNPLECRRWDDLLAASERHSFFHSSNWARVLSEAYGYKPVYFALINNDRFSILIPVMDIKSILTGRRGVSLPFSDYCEPIVDSESQFEMVLDHLIEFGKETGWRYIEIRGSNCIKKDVSYFSFYYDYVLQLSSNEENVAAGFRDSTRRNIQKAVRQGVEAKVYTTPESLQEFYRLHCETRKHHGIPPQPYHFFKKIHEHVIANNQGIVVLASYQGKYVAGAVFFHMGEHALCKFTACDRKCQELRAINLVIWKAIQWYAGRGCSTLSFGRTESDATGLRQFKTGWGVQKRILKYYKYGFKEKRFLGECSAAKEHYYSIFHALPIPLLKIVGTILYEHIG